MAPRESRSGTKGAADKDSGKAKWASPHGRRFTCWKCATKFYDLGRTKAICPHCESDQAEAPLLSEKVPARASKSKAEVPPIEEDILDIIDGETAEPELEGDLDVADADEDDAAEGEAEEEEES
jgi:hypothetical protein